LWNLNRCLLIRSACTTLGDGRQEKYYRLERTRGRKHNGYVFARRAAKQLLWRVLRGLSGQLCFTRGVRKLRYINKIRLIINCLNSGTETLELNYCRVIRPRFGGLNRRADDYRIRNFSITSEKPCSNSIENRILPRAFVVHLFIFVFISKLAFQSNFSHFPFFFSFVM